MADVLFHPEAQAEYDDRQGGPFEVFRKRDQARDEFLNRGVTSGYAEPDEICRNEDDVGVFGP